jgi:putative FmdB family regulatory protein
MPIYRYACGACQATTEVLAKISDPPPATCPHCGGGPLHKAVARTAFHLKGGGWYAQGYNGGGSGGSASTPKGDGGGESKPAESKPAATPSAD